LPKVGLGSRHEDTFTQNPCADFERAAPRVVSAIDWIFGKNGITGITGITGEGLDVLFPTPLNIGLPTLRTDWLPTHCE